MSANPDSVSRWKADPDFVEAIDAAIAAYSSDVAREVKAVHVAHATEASRELVKVLRAKKTPAAVKVKAATALLDLAGFGAKKRVDVTSNDAPLPKADAETIAQAITVLRERKDTGT